MLNWTILNASFDDWDTHHLEDEDNKRVTVADELHNIITMRWPVKCFINTVEPNKAWDTGRTADDSSILFMSLVLIRHHSRPRHILLAVGYLINNEVGMMVREGGIQRRKDIVFKQMPNIGDDSVNPCRNTTTPQFYRFYPS